jgi:hypothetical protein
VRLAACNIGAAPRSGWRGEVDVPKRWIGLTIATVLAGGRLGAAPPATAKPEAVAAFGPTDEHRAVVRATLRLRRDEGSAEEERKPDARPSPLGDPFAYLAAVVRGAVRVEPTDLSALANNVTVARTLDAARESARTGRTVRLAPAGGGRP